MIFMIDSDLDVSVVGKVPEQPEAGTTHFSSEAQLAAIADSMPTSRLVELWNSFAGVVPFDDLKPVEKFATKGDAVKRIWKAVQRLGRQDGEPHVKEADEPEADPPAHKPHKAEKKEAAPKPQAHKPKNKPKAEKKDRPTASKRSVALELIGRKSGATLDQIVERTESTRRSASNFINELRADGHKIERKREGDAWVYSIKG